MISFFNDRVPSRGYVFLIYNLFMSKNKSNKKKEKLSKEEMEFQDSIEKTKELQRIVVLLLDLLISSVNKDKDNFDPLLTKKTMSDIDKEAKKLLDTLSSSMELKTLLKDNERKIELKSLIDQLKSVKPTRWSRDAYFACNVITEKAKFINEDEENKEIIAKVNKIFKWN